MGRAVSDGQAGNADGEAVKGPATFENLEGNAQAGFEIAAVISDASGTAKLNDPVTGLYPKGAGKMAADR